MRKMLVGAGMTLLAFATTSANAATVIQTVNYTSDSPANFSSSVVRGPGRYRFEIDVTSPLTYLIGSADKTVNYDFFCDFGDGAVACGGDDYPQPYDFVSISPLKYVADVTVLAPYSVPNGGSPFTRTDYHDTCCNVLVDFQGHQAGTATLSVSAVPEPQTWALLILGFGAVGVAMRHPSRRCRDAVS